MFQAAFAIVDYSLRRLLSRLAEDFKNHYRVALDLIQDPPTLILILYSQFMATRADTRHWSRMRQRQIFSALQAPQQNACLNASTETERRRLYFSTQPDQRFVLSCHYYPKLSLCQM